MSTHVKIIGWLHIVSWGLILLFSVLSGGIAATVGLASGDADGAAIGGILGALSVLFGLLAVPGILIGWGLLKYRGWARILGIILAVINLAGFPFGTALGIYTLWVLFNDEVAQRFRTGGQLAY